MQDATSNGVTLLPGSANQTSAPQAFQSLLLEAAAANATPTAPQLASSSNERATAGEASAANTAAPPSLPAAASKPSSAGSTWSSFSANTDIAETNQEIVSAATGQTSPPAQPAAAVSNGTPNPFASANAAGNRANPVASDAQQFLSTSPPAVANRNSFQVQTQSSRQTLPSASSQTGATQTTAKSTTKSAKVSASTTTGAEPALAYASPPTPPGINYAAVSNLSLPVPDAATPAFGADAPSNIPGLTSSDTPALTTTANLSANPNGEIAVGTNPPFQDSLLANDDTGTTPAGTAMPDSDDDAAVSASETTAFPAPIASTTAQAAAVPSLVASQTPLPAIQPSTSGITQPLARPAQPPPTRARSADRSSNPEGSATNQPSAQAKVSPASAAKTQTAATETANSRTIPASISASAATVIPETASKPSVGASNQAPANLVSSAPASPMQTVATGGAAGKGQATASLLPTSSNPPTAPSPAAPASTSAAASTSPASLTTAAAGTAHAAALPTAVGQSSASAAVSVAPAVAAERPTSASSSNSTPQDAMGSAAEPADPQQPTLTHARLTQALNGSQMQVNLSTEEFGRISVHAGYGHDSVTAQITLDNSQLSSAISNHLPAAEQKLAGEHGLRTSITVATGTSGQSLGGGQTGSGGQNNNTANSSKTNPFTRSFLNGTDASPATSIPVAPATSIQASSGRLNITI